jgi:hypothetical protein
MQYGKHCCSCVHLVPEGQTVVLQVTHSPVPLLIMSEVTSELLKKATGQKRLLCLGSKHCQLVTLLTKVGKVPVSRLLDTLKQVMALLPPFPRLPISLGMVPVS